MEFEPGAFGFPFHFSEQICLKVSLFRAVEKNDVTEPKARLLY